MEPPQRRDINELLINGYFKTSRARSPAGLTPTTNSPSFLQVSENVAPRERSRSREPRRQRPPRPTVEDEEVSLARESSKSPPIPSYDPPLRGIIDQNPIILEADVSAAEAARLHAAPHKKTDDNGERRFVLVPQSGSESDAPPKPPRPNQAQGKQPQPVRKEGDNLTPRPPIERRKSRQDLPSLQTKVPRDIPPQFRRSASAYSSAPRDDETPRGNRAPSEYLLSPDVPRGPSKDYFGSAPRHSREESFGGRSVGTPGGDKRKSGGSVGGNSRPTTPLTEKRNSANFDNPRLRRNTSEKSSRPPQLSGEESGRRLERNGSTRSSRGSDRRSQRRQYQSSSESEFTDSGSDRSPRRHRHHRHRELQVEDARRRSSSRNRMSELKPSNSRYNSSPVPSPKVSPSQLPRGDRERAETFPQRSGSRSPISRPVSPFSPNDETPRPSDRLNPLDLPARPRSQQSHSISTPTSTVPYPTTPSSSMSSLPIPIPMPAGPGNRASMPILPQFEEPRANGARSADQRPFWQPPQFQPQSPNNLQPAVGSFRRHSEDVERGSIAPLPVCPRMTFQRGLNDWLTLPQCPSFDICPSCFNSTIAPTEFRKFFVAAPWRGPDAEVLCDFGSSPWYRIAWLLTIKERRRDLKLFYGLANIAATIPHCAGKQAAVQHWHSIIDPKSRTPIQNFNTCYSCVKSIEILLPPIRGIFVPTRSMGDPRVCDLRFDSKRFIQYFDALETTADKADAEDSPPDTRPLASLLKRLSLFPECAGSTDLAYAEWNIITQLPEFTVCEECFDEVVWPELEDKKAIPSMFNKKLVRLEKASCQLYSMKMRGIFRTAVDGDDYKFLAKKARERKGAEGRWKAQIEGLRRLGGGKGVREEVERVEEEWKRWE